MLHSESVDLGLERVAAVAERCGLLPVACPVISVAGTNGKGSTVAFLDAILNRRGLRVGSYTSPHLHSYNERIRIAGDIASDDTIRRAFEFIEGRRGDCPLTVFEYGTLAALKCFLDAECEVMVLEVGLGGRLDAVNIVDPEVSIVTSIGFDHVQWLGTDRDSIAFEKLGIARPGRPLISGDPSPPEMIARRTAEVGASLYQYGEHFHCEAGGSDKESGWRFTFQGRALDLPPAGLYGDMQLRNASCALVALRLLDDALGVDDDALVVGVRDAHVGGRFQIASGGRIVYDIAHNVDGVLELRRNLRRALGDRDVHAVFGALKDKDVDGILNAMKSGIKRWYLAPPEESGRAIDCEGLAAAARRVGLENFEVYASVPQACAAAGKNLTDDDRLVVFGSVFMVAEAQASMTPSSASVRDGTAIINF